MARIRTIKPEFWTSEQVLECSTNARLLFIALWNFADDAGRHPDSEKQIKAEVFPADDFTASDVRGMLDELSENGLIDRYVVDGKKLFRVTGWHHQRIDKPQSPRYPGPIDDYSANDLRTFPPDTIRYDTKGEDRKTSRVRARAADAEGAESCSPEPPPENLDLEAWKRWTEYRTQIRKPLKPASIPAAQRKLAAMGADQARAVEQSVANGWQGLFEPRDGPQQSVSRGTGRDPMDVLMSWQPPEEASGDT